MTKGTIGWILTAAGAALWTYGYFFMGSTPFVDWQSFSPWWIADYLPSKEAELGLLLMCAGMVPLYWPESTRVQP